MEAGHLKRYISMYILTASASILLFFLLLMFGMGDDLDGMMMVVGLVLSLQLSLIICLLFYLIEMFQKNGYKK
jgi:Zn-dependent protease with chaperone function